MHTSHSFNILLTSSDFFDFFCVFFHLKCNCVFINLNIGYLIFFLLKKFSFLHFFLLSHEARGKKYVGALKWGIPALSVRWLEDCISSKGKMRESDYLLANEEAAKPTTTGFIDSEMSKITGT